MSKQATINDVKEEMYNSCRAGAENFRDIDFKTRMQIAGLYFQTLSNYDKWEIIINLNDDYIPFVAGKAMANSQEISFETVGVTLTTALYARLEEDLQQLFIDSFQEYSAIQKEESSAYKLFVNRSALNRNKDAVSSFNV